MAKRPRSKQTVIKATRQLLKLQGSISKHAQTILPEQLKAANVLLTRPDPQKRGEWKKHVFIAPAFNQNKLIARLDYFIFKPSSTARKADSKRMPLVVMLHGCQQDAALFAQGTQMNVIAQRNRFVVLYPQQSRRNHISNCWRWHHIIDGPGMAEANTIMKIIRSAVIMHDLDPQKIYVAGLSAGAAMAGVLAASYPDQFAAVAMHSCPVLGRAHDTLTAVNVMQDSHLDSDQALASYIAPLNPHEKHLIPTQIIQGQRDKVVNQRNADELVKQFLYINNLPMDTAGLSKTHFAGSNKEYHQTIYRAGSKRILELIKVRHLNHAWAGGDAHLPFNSTHGPNSSQLIWEFFKRHMPK